LEIASDAPGIRFSIQRFEHNLIEPRKARARDARELGRAGVCILIAFGESRGGGPMRGYQQRRASKEKPYAARTACTRLTRSTFKNVVSGASHSYRLALVHQ
jgi:hypothetical protein